MRALAGVVLLFWCVPAFAGELPAPAEELVFLEVEAEPATPFVGQPFRLTLRVGVERSFAETNLVPLFNRRMDLPLHLRATWLADLPNVEVLADPVRDPESERRSLAVNDDVIEAARGAERTVGGREFIVVEIHRELRALVPGELRLSAPSLRFAWGTEFVKDFISGERPKDRRDLTVTGKPRPLTIRPLPEEDRPANFTGAVGYFTVRTAADQTRAEVGDQVELTMTIVGRGNFATFDTPDLGALPGFHVLGAIDDHGADRRTVVYDLVVTDGATGGIPAIGFPFFDPGPPPRYRVVRSAPIPLAVAGAPGKETSGPPPAERSGPSVPQILTIAAAVLLLTVSLLITLRRRARARSEVDPEELRAREAAAAVRSAADRTGADVAATFTSYLALRLCCAPAGVISPDLEERLRSAGVPEALAARTAVRVERLVAANYGGSAADSAASLSALVDELEIAFSRP